MAVCPECESPLDIDEDELEDGETIQCDDCGAELEVVSTDPLRLIAVEEEGYDEEEDSFGADDEEV